MVHFLSLCFETFTKDLNEEDSLYEGIIASGEDMINSMDSEEEKKELREKLADLGSLWRRVHDDSVQRKENLIQCV